MSIYDTLNPKTEGGSLTYRWPPSYTGGRRFWKNKSPDSQDRFT